MEFSVRALAAASTAALTLTACAGSSPSSSRYPGLPAPVSPRSGSSSPITHVVVMIQENRSFDDLFATFPGADGATQGLMKTKSGDVYVALKQVDLTYRCDLHHNYTNFLNDYDRAKMDGFGHEGGGTACQGKTSPYQYIDPSQIKPYWDLAQQYVLADHMFQTQGSGSFTAHQDLIAGATIIDPYKTQSLVDYPTGSPWGCDAPQGSVTSLLVAQGSTITYRHHKGPFPCLQYATMRDLLDASSVSWKYYVPPLDGRRGGGKIWNAFEAIRAVRYSSEWGTNVTKSEKVIFKDISHGTLPAVSWLIPDGANSDHPALGSDTGPSWVASVVNAIGESPYWSNTAIVILWDDWGGFYDNVPPPFFDQWGGLGFRVPMLVVSAYAREKYPSQPGYISHKQYEFGSVLKFIEDTFGLGTLGTTDARAASIVNCLDFTQPARTFTPISAKYSRTFFEHQRPSYRPVDAE